MKKLITIAIVSLAFGPAALSHEGDFEVGIDPALNKIKVEFDFDLPVILPPSEFPLLNGFALDDPGFVSLEADEAIPGVFEPLAPGRTIAMRVLSSNVPAMKVWDELGPGEDGFQIIGDRLWTIGSAFFDDHPVWHLDSSDPSYVPNGGPWTVTFELLELTPGNVAGYSPSDPVTVTFIPEPAAVSLLALGGLVALRRR